MTDHRATALLLCAALTALLLGVLIHAFTAVDPEPGTDAARSTATATPLSTSTTAAPTTTTSTTTTSTTTTTEPVVVAAASEPILSTGHCGGHGDLIARYFPAEQVGKACRVMLCESGGSATAQNPRSTASGIFQFLDGTWRSARALVGADQYARAMHAPVDVQIAAAAAWWRATSWSQWECR